MVEAGISDAIVTQCSSDPVQYIYDCNQDTDMADEYHFLLHVIVFGKVEEPNIDKFRLEILRSLGDKVHVQCNCSNFPLVPTNKLCDQKQRCNRCHRFESFVCCNSNCSLRLCNTYYDTYPTHQIL